MSKPVTAEVVHRAIEGILNTAPYSLYKLLERKEIDGEQAKAIAAAINAELRK